VTANSTAATAQIATTVIQEARARDTVGIFTYMADAAATEVASGDAAEAALAFLTEMSSDLRGAAVLDSEGTVLAASGDRKRWQEDAATLLGVADGAGGEPVEQIHVATEQGEVFALRHAGLIAVAVSERFALASLLFFDMRSALRDLARGNRQGGGD
jgi:predicted regulator of Ras-like GTPase activity (Roadblock/LC7/MglB family)